MWFMYVKVIYGLYMNISKKYCNKWQKAGQALVQERV